jgi:hypothetical protein
MNGQTRRELVGDPEAAQDIGDVNTGGRPRGVGDVESGRASQRGGKLGALSDRRQRIAGANRDAGAHAPERRARPGHRAASSIEIAIIGAVRITTSQRSPASSFSASAPTAPNVASISALSPRETVRDRLDDALRRTGAQ